MKWLKNLFKRKPPAPMSDFQKYGEMLANAYLDGTLEVTMHKDFEFDYKLYSSRTMKNLRNYALIYARINGRNIIITRDNRVKVLNPGSQMSLYSDGIMVDAYTAPVFELVFDDWLASVLAAERVQREKEDAVKREAIETVLGIKK